MTSERISADVQAARDLLAPPMPDDPQDLIARLSEAAQRVQSALDEAMAVAALDGFSMRAIALPAKVAPNSVPPRLPGRPPWPTMPRPARSPQRE